MPTSLNINPHLWKEAKIEAINRGITLTELLEDALRNEIHNSDIRKKNKNKSTQTEAYLIADKTSADSEFSHILLPSSDLLLPSVESESIKHALLAGVKDANLLLPSVKDANLLLPSVKDANLLQPSVKQYSDSNESIKHALFESGKNADESKESSICHINFTEPPLQLKENDYRWDQISNTLESFKDEISTTESGTTNLNVNQFKKAKKSK